MAWISKETIEAVNKNLKEIIIILQFYAIYTLGSAYVRLWEKHTAELNNQIKTLRELIDKSAPLGFHGGNSVHYTDTGSAQRNTRQEP